MEDGNLSLKQYEESETPYRLPDNMDIFTWSLPFLVEKVINMTYQIVNKTAPEDDEGNEGADQYQKQATEEQKKAKKSVFKAKL